ncbi:MAG TPA: LysR family transcriptional regulator [Amaricoccus sp.]|uniref:LysR family transcriptional regulator n=1 Tax=Amaricoccus sp. TaxID=1872485 RepID=UPI001E1632DD|nr:LysR family transcriptional regulator [Amaricoccus sp.]MCB1374718.1 LysR family transcriptional regulator [Paracoccaceae bacterium]MCB1401897.1 LysR family transcriptional regulator [Paracoccaceae bacterium]HPG22003.1 LysR family transcriptional regulator [Amaricoccus sp.]HRW15705.1 LysR family transcriptional regulator [Amaricoccus sp.]
MDRLTEMEAFVRVVDHGGFTEAARQMGLSKSAVSKHVSALEKRLAVRLLTRTTRRVSPTELGLAYYDRARAVLEDAAEADSMVTAMQATPRGSLRISAPVSFGIGQISRAVARFLEAYPQVEVNMVLDDRFVELLAEGFDLAIRIGVLEDSTLKARKLAETRLLLAASPAYLAERGVPQSIDDLNDHCLLHYSNLSTGNFWRLRGRGGAERQIRVGGRFTANNGESLRKVAEAGIGVVMLPSFILGDALRAGRLVEVLPDREPVLLGIHALYPQGPFPQPKLRAFVDFLAEHFRGAGPDDWPA